MFLVFWLKPYCKSSSTAALVQGSIFGTSFLQNLSLNPSNKSLSRIQWGNITFSRLINDTVSCVKLYMIIKSPGLLFNFFFQLEETTCTIFCNSGMLNTSSISQTHGNYHRRSILNGVFRNGARLLIQQFTRLPERWKCSLLIFQTIPLGEN